MKFINYLASLLVEGEISTTDLAPIIKAVAGSLTGHYFEGNERYVEMALQTLGALAGRPVGEFPISLPLIPAVLTDIAAAIEPFSTSTPTDMTDTVLALRKTVAIRVRRLMSPVMSPAREAEESRIPWNEAWAKPLDAVALLLDHQEPEVRKIAASTLLRALPHATNEDFDHFMSYLVREEDEAVWARLALGFPEIRKHLGSERVHQIFQILTQKNPQPFVFTILHSFIEYQLGESLAPPESLSLLADRLEEVLGARGRIQLSDQVRVGGYTLLPDLFHWMPHSAVVGRVKALALGLTDPNRSVKANSRRILEDFSFDCTDEEREQARAAISQLPRRFRNAIPVALEILS